MRNLTRLRYIEAKYRYSEHYDDMMK